MRESGEQTTEATARLLATTHQVGQQQRMQAADGRHELARLAQRLDDLARHSGDVAIVNPWTEELHQVTRLSWARHASATLPKNSDALVVNAAGAFGIGVVTSPPRNLPVSRRFQSTKRQAPPSALNRTRRQR